MSVPGPILQEIHRLMRLDQDLAEKIDQGPRQLKAQQNIQAKQEEALKKAQDAIKHLKVVIHEKEGAIKGVDHHIEKLRKTEISNKKEYDALLAEIAVAQKSKTALEDEILEAMGQSEDMTKQLPELEKAVQKAKSDVQNLEKDHQDKMARFATERAQAKAELEQVSATLPEDFRVQYTRPVVAKGPDALALVQGANCQACYTAVTPQMANDLSRGLFVLCKSCGRMLYGAK